MDMLDADNSPLSTAFAQGTAFTYQGRLNNVSDPVTGKIACCTIEK
jgi:hypothetical protein